MHPEDLPDPGTYVDPETGDIWEKFFSGQWRVNGMIHKPFPHALTPEPRVLSRPAVTIDDVVQAAIENEKVGRDIDAHYEEWRKVVYYPKYEVNRAGTIRYVENKTVLAPSQGDSHEEYYPLLDAENVVHHMALSDILHLTFPESKL